MTPRKHAGAKNELLACTYLLEHGFEVFRNVSQHGTADLVAVKAGEILLIDVKARQVNRQGHQCRTLLTERQREEGVVVMDVFSDGRCVLDRVPPAPLAPTPCVMCGKQFPATQTVQRRCVLATLL
jgi:Holliday junction resolvase-like predicted endonuclease